ncbi:MAG: tetraacyldisaccharide 4'-kinase, partial [Acidobacteriota bacterium]
LVARLLVEAGERPAILSRGYGRAIADDGVTVVSDGCAVLSDVAHSGDEPLMLARAVPGAAVLVCEQRALAGTLAETALGCTVHILDDGFQHHQLRRDIDIVLIAPEDLTARVMPFGRLREPIDALCDADAILIDTNEAMGQWGNEAMGFIAPLPHCPIAPFRGVLARRLGAPSPRLAPSARVFAVAGIASPERFFDTLTAAGWTLAGTMGFKDHHRFSAADARRIGEEAARCGADAIVTTSKDAIRFEALGPWPVPMVEMPLEVSVEPAEPFRAWLLESLRHNDDGRVLGLTPHQ